MASGRHLLVPFAAAAALAVLPFAAGVHATARLSQADNARIEDHINRRLEETASVKKYDITVHMNGDTAVLTGVVATKTAKSEAERLANVPGVSKVDNQITVDPTVDRTLAQRARTGMRRTGDAVSDTWITTKVKWFFLDDELLKGSHIDATTDHRVVTLSGTVPSPRAREHALALVNDTDGVARVVDHLSIAK